MARLGSAVITVGAVLFVLGTCLDLNRPVCCRFDQWEGRFGTGYLGSIRSVSQLAEIHERAGLISAVYLVSYVAFSIRHWWQAY